MTNVILGMLVVPLYLTPSDGIFNIKVVASTMLKNAIDAKSSKIDKKLKMVELQLKKLKLDKTGKLDPEPVESEGMIISDRNELMKKLLKKD